MNRLRYCSLALCMVFAWAAAGCATADRRINLLYQPVSVAGHGTGTIFLAVEKHDSVQAAENEWALGTVKNSDGQKVGNVLSPRPAEEIVADAFKQQLSAAGYQVLPVSSIPGDAAAGLSLAKIDLSVNEVAALLKREASSAIKVTVDVWKGGAKVKRLEYGVALSDVAVKDRDQLSQDILRQGLESIMQQAIPEIVGILQR